MFIFKLIYLAIIIACSFFFILYKDVLALLLLIVVLCIPVLLFLSLLIMALGVRIKTECDNTVITTGDKAVIRLRISNYSILPVNQIKLYVRYKNSFFSAADKSELAFSAKPFSKTYYNLEFDSKHAGNVQITIKKARIIDYFGLFTLPVKAKRKFTVAFLPKLCEPEFKLRRNIYTLSEADTYSKDKPGDDPSEIFAIRDYVDGDKINRIHWKLSSKQNKFMVKDYGLPICESVLLLPELIAYQKTETDLNLVDTVLEVIFSLSHRFIESGTIHTIVWYNTNINGVQTQKVESLDDLYQVFGLIFNSTKYYTVPYLASLDMEYLHNMSNVIYVSPTITPEQCSKISNTENPNAIYTLINVVSNDSDVNTLSHGNFYSITVKENKVYEALNETRI